ncbi:Maf family protein [Thermoactinomyces mirandus]|uniref:dTTP/UTP pyrophosphatase n=1 Tax=Thermoactinomyces mirandus TaxID=2756294 RepID=A0A7W1XT38_9BACL|nr:Maf family protein [Thermoactinomyces mirandus]MBA4602715.1 septum formation inhibitor Maf [Thermoactinomyces mirandus]
MQREIVLASGSPRRKELLARIGVPFRVQTSDVDETVDLPLSPDQVVEELALRKGRVVAARCENALVIGADTVVVYQGEIMGKPADQREAAQMLGELSGKEHQVYSGIALLTVNQGKITGEVVSHRMTRVWMRSLTPEKITWYVNTKEPLDKAGAYGIQGLGACLVDRIEGCYFNVVGMSLALLDEMLSEVGFSIAQD